MDMNERVFKNVKFLAKEKSIMLRDVEKHIGIAPGYISRRKFSIDHICRLAEVLGVSVSDLVERDYEEEKRSKEAEKGRVLDAFRNCISEPQCRDCPWKECEEMGNRKIEIPVDLALAVDRLFVSQMGAGK